MLTTLATLVDGGPETGIWQRRTRVWAVRAEQRRRDGTAPLLYDGTDPSRACPSGTQAAPPNER